MSADHYLPFALPDIGEEEIEAVSAVLRSGWLTTGDRCKAFEREFADFVGARHAVAVNSGTAAMHLSLEAAGVRRGDFVVTSPYTFAATAEVIRYFDAVPILVDIDPSTFNIDVEALGRCLSELSTGEGRALPPAMRGAAEGRAAAAIMPVHIAGSACDLDEIFALAKHYGSTVVEDAAHAVPTTYKGRPVGATAEASVLATTCFSFYATKTITTGEGGMLVTDDLDLAERARVMSLHGITKTAWDRSSRAGTWHYEVEAAGYKYNMTDVSAAMGLVQLRKADAMRQRRADIAATYDAALAGCEGLEVPGEPVAVESSWHLYMLRLHLERLTVDRSQFIDELTERGIGTSVHFIPLHHHPYYRNTYGYEPGDFPVATREYLREVSLPIYSAMTDADVERVLAGVLAAAKKFRR